MVPISGPARPGFVPPRTGLKLTRVADTGVAIVPLYRGVALPRPAAVHRHRPHLARQIVTDGDRTAYASLFAR
ncbi:hypothetical protein BKA00_001787 [Actinomadura coerulea]|uniref:Uncharacterized protein n=1 Tax=Actinomadura coerulea TaxID=46159 RepID=A0A7X0FW88_9ACTN|nr:hypothetical protein [Actinomadura coerulea]MBB6394873.1 hypothetical protein [Actinomadura coerulea]GGQ31457.1 hypothetical protein GCM10010187_55400 [Actinomadura coerulea]